MSRKHKSGADQSNPTAEGSSGKVANDTNKMAPQNPTRKTTRKST